DLVAADLVVGIARQRHGLRIRLVAEEILREETRLGETRLERIGRSLAIDMRVLKNGTHEGPAVEMQHAARLSEVGREQTPLVDLEVLIVVTHTQRKTAERIGLD